MSEHTDPPSWFWKIMAGSLASIVVVLGSALLALGLFMGETREWNRSQDIVMRQHLDNAAKVQEHFSKTIDKLADKVEHLGHMGPVLKDRLGYINDRLEHIEGQVETVKEDL